MTYPTESQTGEGRSDAKIGGGWKADMNARGNIVRFGVFELDAGRGSLRTLAGSPIPLQPQPMKVLAVLVRRRGELVTREELRWAVWGADTHVDFDRGLNFCVKQIRTALGDDSRMPRYIETLPRVGYRLVAPVEPVLAPEPERADRPPSDRTPRLLTVSTLLVVALALAAVAGRARHSAGPNVLAVLPFENLSGDPAQDFLADGMTEEMIAQIGRLSPGSLAVIGRPSVMRYRGTRWEWRDLARELGAQYVIVGSVRRNAVTVHVTTALLRVPDPRPIWTASEALPTADLFSVQQRVAQGVARALALRLLPSEATALARAATANTAAYESHLRGRQAMQLGTQEAFQAAVQAFGDAVRLDPEFAPAFAGRAGAYLRMAEFSLVAPDVACPLARPEAERALALDPALPEAHARMAEVLSVCEPATPRIDAEYRQALALNPSDAEARLSHAWSLFGAQRLTEAEAEAEAALRLDPASPYTHSAVAYFLFVMGRHEDCLQRARAALTLDPEYPFALFVLGRVLSEQGHHQEAIAALRRAVAMSGDKPKYVLALGIASARAGQGDEAKRQLAELQNLATDRYVPPHYIEAMTTFCRALDEHAGLPTLMF